MMYRTLYNPFHVSLSFDSCFRVLQNPGTKQNLLVPTADDPQDGRHTARATLHMQREDDVVKLALQRIGVRWSFYNSSILTMP